jgi:beta-glucosidase
MRYAPSPEFPKVRDNAYRVRAQVDVLMPGGESFAKQKYVFDKAQIQNLNQPERLTRAELQRSAMNVLRFALLRIQEKTE